MKRYKTKHDLYYKGKYYAGNSIIESDIELDSRYFIAVGSRGLSSRESSASVESSFAAVGKPPRAVGESLASVEPPFAAGSAAVKARSRSTLPKKQVEPVSEQGRVAPCLENSSGSAAIEVVEA